MVEGNNNKYQRKHISLKPDTYQEFIKLKGKTMEKTRENFSDSSFVEFLLEKRQIKHLRGFRGQRFSSMYRKIHISIDGMHNRNRPQYSFTVIS